MIFFSFELFINLYKCKQVKLQHFKHHSNQSKSQQQQQQTLHKNKIYPMEKSIFKKKNIKKTSQSQMHNQQANSRQYKEQQIVSMSVREIQNSLINKINMSSSNQHHNSNNYNSKQFDNNSKQLAKGQNFQAYSNSESCSSKQIPQLMLENQQMKEQIQSLKKEKKLIIQKYEQALSLSRNIQSQIRESNSTATRPFQKLSKKNQEFSFRRSIDQAQRESLIPNFQKKQFIQDILQRRGQQQHEYQKNVSINDNKKNSQNSQNFSINKNPQNANSSLDATMPVTSSLLSNKNTESNQLKRRSKLGRSVETRHQNMLDPQNSKQHIHRYGAGQKDQTGNYKGVSSSLGKNTNLISKSRFNGLRNHTGPKSALTLQDKFYQYCKNEIVRVNAENAKLNLKLGELENRLTTLGKENQNLKFINQHLASSNSALQSSLQQYKVRLQKLSIQFQKSLQSQKQNHSKEIARLQKEINQNIIQKRGLTQKLLLKENQAVKMKIQLKNKQQKCQNFKQISQHKAFLEMELNQSINRNRKLREKYIKSSAIDHLWQIKQVQFAGIIELLQKSKLSQ